MTNQTFPEIKSMLSGAEVVAQYASSIGKTKAESPIFKLFLLGIVSGMMISFGAVGAVTASHAITNPGVARLVSGALFPFGLGMVMLIGVELFTGNTMIFISVLDKQTHMASMLKNWFFVYFGNMAGSFLLAVGIVYSGQLGLGGGALAVSTIQIAANKCALSFGPSVVLGIFCNLLVCLGVLCSLTAKDTAGRILGAYIPVCLFVIGGFEHCIANMYYIPAGIFAMANPAFATAAVEAGIDTALLGWGGFVSNLVPVTIGNILGGAGVAAILWIGHCRIKKAG